jgi:hypothetical protein
MTTDVSFADFTREDLSKMTILLLSRVSLTSAPSQFNDNSSVLINVCVCSSNGVVCSAVHPPSDIRCFCLLSLPW